LGITNICVAEVGFDEGFDEGSENADGDVAAYALFGPVVDGPKRDEVFEFAETVFDFEEFAVGSDGALG
jgi:hypothetical protein